MNPNAASKTPDDQNNNDEKKKTILITKLSELNDYVQNGDIENIKTIIEYFYADFTWNKNMLEVIYKSRMKCVTQNEVIISACLYKQAKVLNFLLNETDILDHLTDESFDDQQVELQKKTAFRHALCAENINMVEMLYDYWSEYNISNMERLADLFEAISTELEEHLIKEEQMMVDVRCLIKFNAFQLELYKYLQAHPVDKNNKEITMLDRLLGVLNIYDKYTDLANVRCQLSDPERERALQDLLSDNSSKLCKSFLHIMYEVYFRKLDFNVCLHILEGVSVLRDQLSDRFKKPKEIYQNNPSLHKSYTRAAALYDEIECAVYHYIYRTSEDWRLYLPGDRQPKIIENRIGLYKGKKYTLRLKFDPYKLYNGPVLFLERMDFQGYVHELKELINNHVLSPDPVQNNSPNNTPQKKSGNNQKKKTSPLVELMDDNYLKQTPYMRDIYSLRKIMHYIEAVGNCNEINVVMIERAVQVIGEMLKSTKKSNHLSKSTEALLHTATSVEIIGHLHNLRKYLARVEEGQLTTRINVATGPDQIFIELKEDLKNFLQIISPIFEIFKYVLDKWLLEKGIQFLDKNVEELPDDARQRKNNIYDLFIEYGSDFEDDFVETDWEATGLSRQLLREIPLILSNRDDLISKKELASAQITKITVIVLPIYIANMKKTLEHVIEINKKVTDINNALDKINIKKLPLCPNKKVINLHRDRILGKQKELNINLNQPLQMLDDVEDLTVHWASLNFVLKFFLCEIGCELFTKIKTDFVKDFKEDNVPNEQTIIKIQSCLGDMEKICTEHKDLYLKKGITMPSYPDLNNNYSFNAIKKLDNDIFTINKVGTDMRTKREQLLSCLKDRLDKLKVILEYPQQLTLSQYLRKYKRDQKFRFELEMLLGDIANILVHCKIRSMYSSGKLLNMIDLGNVLDHGNPFLEVIGERLDSRDYPTALWSKAIMLANDWEPIVALYELFKTNIDHDVIKEGNNTGMNNAQKKYLEQFKMCDLERQQSYLKLVYVYKKK